MRAYGARGHLPVSDLPHGGTGTDAPTIPGTALPTAPQQQHKQRGQGAGDAVVGQDAATDTINRHGVP